MEKKEMESLNLDDLNVEVLEQRLELMTTTPSLCIEISWCGCNGYCPCDTQGCYVIY